MSYTLHLTVTLLYVDVWGFLSMLNFLTAMIHDRSYSSLTLCVYDDLPFISPVRDIFCQTVKDEWYGVSLR